MPESAAPPEVLEIRRYPNRRLYDVTRSKTVTLDELHRLVVEGRKIRVTETATGEDITARFGAVAWTKLDADERVDSIDQLNRSAGARLCAAARRALELEVLARQDDAHLQLGGQPTEEGRGRSGVHVQCTLQSLYFQCVIISLSSENRVTRTHSSPARTELRAHDHE